MKKIVVISIEKKAKEKYMENLAYFFNGYAEITGICIRENNAIDKVDADVAVVSNQIIFNEAKAFIKDSTRIVYVDISFYHDNIEKLKNIERGAKVLLIDYREYMAISLVGLLSEYGIQHVDFIPYAPEMDIDSIGNLDEIKTIVTPGLYEYIPPSLLSTDREIIDIGYRKIDISTISNIALKLGINDDVFNEKLINYSSDLIHKNHSITYILKNLKENANQINAILGNVDDGVIIVDRENHILHCNRFVCNLMGIKDCYPDNCSEKMNHICKKLLAMKPVENHIIKLDENQCTVIVTKKNTEVYNELGSSTIIIKSAEKIQNIEISLRKDLLARGYVAKYTFDDIVYKGSAMADCVKKAKKISAIDATTLIIGDTGTGKELLAHAIHNSSKRKDYPFIAINCAAISENLLESELFGYEEGAFTGAKKGGKKGLFELAHKGTIFLDEIGDISQTTQIKLLRVLQEKEVMRIGGINIVPVDVRVIVATNRNLEELVEKNAFRKDLYYRLNVFTINVPPLKSRREDIPLLIQAFMDQHRINDKTISDGLMKYLIEYEWKGNVRELHNCIKYLVFMGRNLLTYDDLPAHMKLSESIENSQRDLRMGELFEEEKQIAEKVLEICTYRSLGRRGLQKLISEHGYQVSEYRLRKILEYLKDKNLIYYGRGREGIKKIGY
jgi:transcriptional regulator with PAS, ATPase and Fis domain